MDTDRIPRLAATTALAAAVISAGCLAAGCAASGGIGAAASSVASNLPSRSASFSPGLTFSPDGRAGAGAAAQSPGTGARQAASPAQTADSAPPSSPATTPTPEPPTSAAATSAPPTSGPATPASSAPSAGPSATSPVPAASTSPPASLWLWLLVAAVALAGLITWVVYASRRSARKREWRAQTIDAYAKGSALADAIRIAVWPEAETATNGRARLADIQRRMDDLAQTLYRLRVTAPGAAERAQVEDVLAGLQALHSEMAAGRARNPAGPAGPRSRERGRPTGLAGRLQFFEDRLRDLRDGTYPS